MAACGSLNGSVVAMAVAAVVAVVAVALMIVVVVVVVVVVGGGGGGGGGGGLRRSGWSRSRREEEEEQGGGEEQGKCSSSTRVFCRVWSIAGVPSRGPAAQPISAFWSLGPQALSAKHFLRFRVSFPNQHLLLEFRVSFGA